jgi:murein endopeptidase
LVVVIGLGVGPARADRVRAPARAKPRAAALTDDAKARRALEVVDGTATKPRPRSLGEPWDGELEGAARLAPGDGYQVRRPSRAYGAPHVVDHLRRVIAEVRALYPDVHTLAIGDLSAEHGGPISDHHSHQTGLDVDVGFFYTHVPAGYPAQFVAGDRDLDVEATWALVTAFARTSDLDSGVEMIFLDRAIQARLYTWAKAHGTPDDELAYLLQYPRGNDELAGVVRHWPNHADHLHVRFKRR